MSGEDGVSAREQAARHLESVLLAYPRDAPRLTAAQMAGMVSDVWEPLVRDALRCLRESPADNYMTDFDDIHATVARLEAALSD